VQDPRIRVLDGSVMIDARGGDTAGGTGYQGRKYMPCTGQNRFFPVHAAFPRTALVYF
jgi:LL-diaminopimelate aminotransferase